MFTPQDDPTRIAPYDEGVFQAGRLGREPDIALWQALGAARRQLEGFMTRVFRRKEREFLAGYIAGIEEEIRRRARLRDAPTGTVTQAAPTAPAPNVPATLALPVPVVSRPHPKPLLDLPAPEESSPVWDEPDAPAVDGGPMRLPPLTDLTPLDPLFSDWNEPAPTKAKRGEKPPEPPPSWEGPDFLFDISTEAFEDRTKGKRAQTAPPDVWQGPAFLFNGVPDELQGDRPPAPSHDTGNHGPTPDPSRFLAPEDPAPSLRERLVMLWQGLLHRLERLPSRDWDD